MKKICMIVLMCGLLMTGWTWAETDVNFSNETGIVTLSGKLSQQGGAVSVLITKPSVELDSLTEENLAQMTVMAYEITPEADGSISGRFKLPRDAEFGTYRVYIGEEEPVSFYYANPEEIQEAVRAVQKATADTIGTVLIKYTTEKDILGLDLNGDYQMTASAVNRALAELVQDAAPQSIGEIKACFAAALDIGRIAIGNESQVKAALTANSLALKLDGKAEVSALAAMVTVLRGTEIINRNAVEKLVRTASTLVRINLATKGEMTEVLNSYNDILGLELTGDYLSLDTIEINKALVGKNFRSVKGVQEAFSGRILQLKQSQNTGSHGGGGGGGGVTSSYELTATPTQPPLPTPQPSQSPQPEERFNDLEQEAWAIPYINALAGKNIVQGTGEGRFAPRQEVTREQFLKMLLEAFGMKGEYVETGFSDVVPEMWYAPYISQGVALGIVKGTDETNFGVGKSVSREEMAVMAARLLEQQQIALPEGTAQFVDFDEISAYAKNAVGGMQQAGLIDGMADGRFAPRQPLSRAQAAKVIYQLLAWKDGGNHA